MSNNTLWLGVPHEKQKAFLRAKARFVGFGGARGGGKSFIIDRKAILMAYRYAGFISTIIRRTYPELKDNHVEPMKRLLRCGRPDAFAVYNQSEKEMRFPNGSIIRFRFCDNEQALGKIQGQQTDFLFIDEATNFPEDWLKKMYACVRGTNGYPKRTYLTCNPSGIGVGYIKRIFIDRRFEEGENPADFEFIQSLLTDNVALMAKDSGYLKQLEALPPKLRQAWLYGDWDSLEGMFFEDFRQSPDLQKCKEAGISLEEAREQHRWVHVIKPFDIPQSWEIYRSYDYGYGKPFSVGWWAVSHDDVAYRILELYGCKKGEPDVGVQWTASEQMEKIAEIEREHPYLKGKRIQGVADPAIWKGEMNAIEEAEKRGLWFEPADNERIMGWMQVHERLAFDENGFARMYFFDNCKAIIRTMPLMMYDEHKDEDLNTKLEDHACDETRYFCMSRPVPPRMIQKEYKPRFDPLNQYVTEKPNTLERFMERR